MPALLALPRRMFTAARTATTRYGPAYLLLSTLLSWSNLLLIYIALRASQTDVRTLVRGRNLPARVEQAAETGGLFALAVVLNKMLSPLRLLVCILVLGRYAPAINFEIERCRDAWRRWRGTEIAPKVDDAKQV
ncbi:hypothetical protein HDU89_005083 [Geranomyces variabilis]|nr:hypothetical protein BDZ88DRAFT_439726 [Geranomyces variabilis]KAJ3138415.1 hypothetical protein HDU90_001379 [Geranomyces variabilis]KAJ3148009.1 hypothetical protein HDU89_005083 [Geranomyces variabilis]KAJ3170603.1 hypothetical protein HDU88_008505 [Geranomyces variabilis]